MKHLNVQEYTEYTQYAHHILLQYLVNKTFLKLYSRKYEFG